MLKLRLFCVLRSLLNGGLVFFLIAKIQLDEYFKYFVCDTVHRISTRGNCFT